jgi:N-acetylglucosaminyldiphosphoundecaprenol N-acetyl-beta-D-mannosaminyltransferase
MTVKITIVSTVFVVEYFQQMCKVNVLGVGIDPLTLEETLGFISRTVDSNRRALVVHANITGLNLAYEHPWLRAFYNGCDLVYCDGMGVIVGARWLGWRIPARYTLADWIWMLAEQAAQQGESLFLLGNPPGVAKLAAENLQQHFSSLCIAGVQHGFFEKASGCAENELVVEQINAARPNILLVGMGMPVQERWLMENWPRLDVNVAITCGALFEYLSGDLPRGPRWMTQYYLEWLARLIISPRRYAGRYLRDLPLYSYRIVRQKFALRLTEHG